MNIASTDLLLIYITLNRLNRNIIERISLFIPNIPHIAIIFHTNLFIYCYIVIVYLFKEENVMTLFQLIDLTLNLNISSNSGAS